MSFCNTIFSLLFCITRHTAMFPPVSHAKKRGTLAFSTEKSPRKNPGSFLGFTFLAFSRVKWILGSQVVAHSHVMRPTKTCVAEPFQIPVVFSMKLRISLKVNENLHVMRSTAPTFIRFFRKKRLAGMLPSRSVCLLRRSDEFTCDAANGPVIRDP